MVQLELHMLKVFCAHTPSTDVVEHVVMHSWMGLNSQEDEALRNTPPQRSSAFAWPVVGNSDSPKSKAVAVIVGVIRRFMVRLPRVVKGAAWQFAD